MMTDVAVIGAGPAGLMAAEQLAAKGFSVTVFDALPSPGRKFLMAGRGGLNLTHSEDLARFKERYGAASSWMAPLIDAFPPSALIQWCEGLGEATFIGSSGRVFPRSMKASPLLRAWLRRLADMGVVFSLRHRWLGWREGALLFSGPEGEVQVKARATLLALGGASWPKLGSDGTWAKLLSERGIKVQALQPANCGVQIAWSDYLPKRFAGQPIKPLTISCAGQQARGEAVITAKGLEGGALYALTPAIRESLARDGKAALSLDLQPTLTLDDLSQRLARNPSGSLSTRLKRVGLSPAAIALLHEGGKPNGEAEKLAALIKSFPLTVSALSGLERAISTAGGIALDQVNQGLMLKSLPGVFVAGEMLDWEAPTGGYLLQGCFATAVAAAKGIGAFLKT